MKFINYISVFVVILGVSVGSLLISQPKSSLPQIANTIKKEVSDVEGKLAETRLKLKEIEDGLADVKKIASDGMSAPSEIFVGDEAEVSDEHIKAINAVKDEAIGLHATPTGTSLNKFVDRLVKTQKMYQESNNKLREIIKDKTLLKKLESVTPTETPVVPAPEVIAPAVSEPAPVAPIVALPEQAAPVEPAPVVEQTPVGEPTATDLTSTLPEAVAVTPMAAPEAVPAEPAPQPIPEQAPVAPEVVPSEVPVAMPTAPVAPAMTPIDQNSVQGVDSGNEKVTPPPAPATEKKVLQKRMKTLL